MKGPFLTDTGILRVANGHMFSSVLRAYTTPDGSYDFSLQSFVSVDRSALSTERRVMRKKLNAFVGLNVYAKVKGQKNIFHRKTKNSIFVTSVHEKRSFSKTHLYSASTSFPLT